MISRLQSLGFVRGARVRVNEKFPYHDSHGRLGTVQRVSSPGAKGTEGRAVAVILDGSPEQLVRWHYTYFDIIGGKDGETRAG